MAYIGLVSFHHLHEVAISRLDGYERLTISSACVQAQTS